ncbi:hypothetical protein [Microbacterium sp. Root280D1]|uniref:hypothetical protein n=1 Tax=Microbacterium sp. Root280D1 TaxID=1736510 RepID=UPI000701B03A|nr:hypothetical protein [Microbacterium sp. Root280D1]KRD51940.1 hypothetical protein ASE34_08465 [Microbacterium sp. Root280D1]
MDGTIILAAVSAVAGGASAIIAWVARADTLDAARRAETAEAAALAAWEQSAAALKDANELAEKQYADRLARERKIRRVEVAEHFRRWYTEEAMRVVLSETMSAEARAEKRDLLIRLSATGEPGASALATEVITALARAKKGNIQTGIETAAKIAELTHSWVEDPEAFLTSREGTITAESLATELQKAVSDLETVIADSNPAETVKEGSHSEHG